MRRYHFHIMDGQNFFDSKGVELADDKAARKHAEAMAASLRRVPLMDKQRKIIKITDDSGRAIARLPVNKPNET